VAGTGRQSPPRGGGPAAAVRQVTARLLLTLR